MRLPACHCLGVVTAGLAVFGVTPWVTSRRLENGMQLWHGLFKNAMVGGFAMGPENGVVGWWSGVG